MWPVMRSRSVVINLNGKSQFRSRHAKGMEGDPASHLLERGQCDCLNFSDGRPDTCRATVTFTNCTPATAFN